MSGASQISAALRATCGEAPAIRSHVERVRAVATNLMSQAAAHGWAGVASSMQGAVEPLGTAVEQLAEYQQAGEGAVEHLDQVNDEGSITRVTQHFAGAEQELGTAGERLDSAIGLLDDAVQACTQAGQKGLRVSLNALREEVIGTRGRVRQLAQDCTAERQAAEAWPQDDSPQGQPTGAASGDSTPNSAGSRSSGRAGSETHDRIKKELASHPPLADVMVKLVDDHQTHPLNVAADLENPARRERTLALLKELADGETLKDGTVGWPGASQPPAPTDPYVSLSTYTAPVILITRLPERTAPISSARTCGGTVERSPANTGRLSSSPATVDTSSGSSASDRH